MGAATTPRSLSFSHMLELPVVKGVIISQGLLLTCDYKDFAFRGVKLDVVINASIGLYSIECTLQLRNREHT